MSKEIQSKIVPKLRFPEFENNADWFETRLGDEGVFLRGLTYSSENVSKEGLLVLRSSNIQNDNLILDKDLVFVNKDCPDSLFLVKGDIVICMSNGSKALVGKNAEFLGNYLDPITIGAFCSLFRPKNSFAKYIFQTEGYQNFISISIGGGNINNLKNSDLEEYKSLIPVDKNEQQKIASCLSSLDEYITGEIQKLEALKTHKKGLMQQLFPAEGERVPKLRFPEFKDSGEWEEKKFGNICSSIASGKSKIYVNGEFDLYGSTGVIGKTNDYCCDGNFILVARVGANAGLLTRANERFGVTDNTLIVSLHDTENIDFIYFTLEKFGLNKLVFGSGQPLITGGQIKSLIINLPKPDEQQKIASCLSSLDDLITAQTEKIEALKMHKKGLMQGLFPEFNLD